MPEEGAKPTADGLWPALRRTAGADRSSRGHARNAASRADERLVAALFALAVGGSVLAIGSVHVPVLVVVALVATAALGIALRYRLAPLRLTVGTPAIICICLVAYTLLQTVPLPA